MLRQNLLFIKCCVYVKKSSKSYYGEKKLKFYVTDIVSCKCSADLILQLLREDICNRFVTRSIAVTCSEYNIFYYERFLWYVHKLLESVITLFSRGPKSL